MFDDLKAQFVHEQEEMRDQYCQAYNRMRELTGKGVVVKIWDEVVISGNENYKDLLQKLAERRAEWDRILAETENRVGRSKTFAAEQ